MDAIDKIQFAFSAYDFEQTGKLGQEEVSLLLRSTTKGLCKISSSTEPAVEEVDKVTELMLNAFHHSSTARPYIEVEEFQTYCTQHPVVSSWMGHFATASLSSETSVQGVNAYDWGVTVPRKTVPGGCARQTSAELAGRRAWFPEADKLVPEEYVPVVSNPAEDVLEPTWIHGLSSSRTKGVAQYGSAGHIIFVASNACVSLSRGDEGWSQKITYLHDHPISCLDVDGATRRLAVSADSLPPRATAVLDPFSPAPPPTDARVVLWDASTMSVKSAFSVPGCGGVRCLSLSTDGKVLLLVHADENCTAAIYDVSSLAVMYTDRLGAQLVADARFAGSPSIFAVAGSKVLDFYVEEGGSFMGSGKLKQYEKRSAQFHTVGQEASDVSMTALCRFENEDEMVSGNAKGHILFWRGRNCLQLLKKHSAAVSVLSYAVSARTVVSGGLDGKVHIYRVANSTLAALSKQQQLRVGLAGQRGGEAQRLLAKENHRLLEVVASLDLRATSSLSAEVQYACLSADGSKVLVAARSGELVELSCVAGGSVTGAADGGDGDEGTVRKIGDDVNGGPLIKAHWSPSLSRSASGSPIAPVWGLCRASGGFASCGGDGTLRLWLEAEGQPHRLVKEIGLDSGCRCVGSSSSEIAVALDGVGNSSRKGAVHVFSLPELTFVTELKDSGDVIFDIKFSPDSYAMATGSKEGKVYMYGGGEGAWKLKFTILAHKAAIKALDFSADGRFVRSWDHADAFFVHEVSGASAVIEKDPEVLRAISWATNSCPCSWDTKGVWSGLTTDPADEVLCADRSQHLLVTGKRSGHLALTRLPAPLFDAVNTNSVLVRAHEGGVSSVLFINDGATLVTGGAEDGNIAVSSYHQLSDKSFA